MNTDINGVVENVVEEVPEIVVKEAAKVFTKGQMVATAIISAATGAVGAIAAQKLFAKAKAKKDEDFFNDIDDEVEAEVVDEK